MSKLPVVTAKELTKILRKVGFIYIRQKGSHAIYRRKDGIWTTVPIHPREDITRGLLRKILTDAELSIEEFNRLRKEK
ncbi:MAG: addiction module toxin, HicA family [Candidatus Aenigmarchaeota archaeon]|nr:addiction module toxin, HicA family [Candidatus Aenigmarchaeota archaeon]